MTQRDFDHIVKLEGDAGPSHLMSVWNSSMQFSDSVHLVSNISVCYSIRQQAASQRAHLALIPKNPPPTKNQLLSCNLISSFVFCCFFFIIIIVAF